MPEPIDICVIDVSFISLTLILPNAFDLLTPNGVILALIKPQFELERDDVGRGGIVRDPALHEKAQQKIVEFAENERGRVEGIASIGDYRHRRQSGIFHMSPKTIGLIAHTGNPASADLVNAVAEEFDAAFDVDVLIEKETAAIAGKEIELVRRRSWAAQTDLLVVLGGDGTILQVAEPAWRRSSSRSSASTSVRSAF